MFILDLEWDHYYIIIYRILKVFNLDEIQKSYNVIVIE